MNVSEKHKSWKSRLVPDYKISIIQVILFFFFYNASLLAQHITGGEGSRFSVLVQSLITGDVIDSKNPDLLMTPASTLKVASTSWALEVLGGDYRFSTGFYIDGVIEKGTLKGDLIIKGGGDGTLGSAYFPSTSADQVLSHIQQRFYEAGIVDIEGTIWIDQSLFAGNHFPAGRLWEDMANYYGAPPAAVSWRDNTFELFLKSPASIGSVCEVIRTDPAFPDIHFTSTVKAAASQKDSAYIFGYPGSADWEVRGSIPAGRASFRIKGALPFPEKLLGEELSALFSAGRRIEVKVSNRPLSYEGLIKIMEIVSPPVHEIIQVINQKSHNLLADHLFLAAARTEGNGYDWDASRISLKRFWKEHLSIPPYRILDGSGLSPKNLVSASFVVGVLRFMHQSPNFDLLKSSLAVGGQKGTLINMWKHPTLAGRVVAKSGYMEGALGYCGYIYTQKGDVLAFSVMVNHMTGHLPAVRQSIESYISDLIIRY
jgi:serine-type D-Ala-D-Ala carboxypeptidase/endopeptidase (penicillin-binding protein 4)